MKEVRDGITKKMPYIDLTKRRFNNEALGLIPIEFAKKNKLIPFGLSWSSWRRRVISVAMTKKPSKNLLLDIEFMTGYKPKIYFAEKRQIMAAIEKQYSKITNKNTEYVLDISQYGFREKFVTLKLGRTRYLPECDKCGYKGRRHYCSSEILSEEKENYFCVYDIFVCPVCHNLIGLIGLH